VLRPKAAVLPENALVPRERLIKPAPNQFTHEITRTQPYYYERAARTPDGEFAPGTRVVLMVYDGGRNCRVVDAQGLYVETIFEGLRSLKAGAVIASR
jgi:hypothetical protein